MTNRYSKMFAIAALALCAAAPAMAIEAPSVPTGPAIEYPQIAAYEAAQAQKNAEQAVDTKNALAQVQSNVPEDTTYKGAVAFPPTDIPATPEGGKLIVTTGYWQYGKVTHYKAVNKNGITEREDWFYTSKMYDPSTKKMVNYLNYHIIYWYDGNNGMFWDAWKERYDCWGRLYQRDTFDMHWRMNNCYRFDPKTGKQLEHVWFGFSSDDKRGYNNVRRGLDANGKVLWHENRSRWGHVTSKEYFFYDQLGNLIRKDHYGAWGRKKIKSEMFSALDGSLIGTIYY